MVGKGCILTSGAPWHNEHKPNGDRELPPTLSKAEGHTWTAGWCSLYGLAHCSQRSARHRAGARWLLTKLRDWRRNALRASREPIVRDNSPSYTAAAIMLTVLPALCSTLKRSSLPAAAWTTQTAWDNTWEQSAHSLARGAQAGVRWRWCCSPEEQ